MKQTTTYPTVVRAKGDEPSILISTVGVDRDGDVLQPEGCIKDSYVANPVVLFGHRRDELPVASTTSLTIEPGRGIRAQFRWLKGDPFADRVRNAFDEGVLRAASVGFIPRESSPRANGRGLHFTSWELLEWSLVPIPANPEAVRTLKSMGLWSADNDVVLELDDADDIALELHDPANLRARYPEYPEFFAAVDRQRDVVLELADDTTADVRRHVASIARAATHAGVRRGLGADPTLDPATRSHVEGLMRSAIREAFAEVTAQAVKAAIARARGQLD